MEHTTLCLRIGKLVPRPENEAKGVVTFIGMESAWNLIDQKIALDRLKLLIYSGTKNETVATSFSVLLFS